jgi:adenine-specific DNA-methyltransferase
MISEINEEYIKIAKERLDQLQHGNIKTRPIGKTIYCPSGKEKVSQIPKIWQTEQGVLL